MVWTITCFFLGVMHGKKSGGVLIIPLWLPSWPFWPHPPDTCGVPLWQNPKPPKYGFRINVNDYRLMYSTRPVTSFSPADVPVPCSHTLIIVGSQPQHSCFSNVLLLNKWGSIFIRPSKLSQKSEKNFKFFRTPHQEVTVTKWDFLAAFSNYYFFLLCPLSA